ncbi:hypothetical protein ACFLU5_17460 [Bacteroidota bacterium]
MERILSLFLVLITVSTSYAQHDFDSLYKNNDHFKKFITSYAKDYDIFNNESPLEMTLKSDFKNLIKRKYKDEYQGAILEYNLNDTVLVRREVKIKARGEFRRKKCMNPPLKINFKKKDVLLPQLREFDKMKMVDVCKNNDLYEQYLITEFLVYKMYNLLTEFSFRVRLLNVNYVDLSGKYKPRTRYAFFIEDIDQLAFRHDAIRYQMERISPKSTDQEITGILDVFQYMIGNTDYYIPMEHNIKMIKINDVTKPRPIVIPYDFDYAGIINAMYAVPGELWPIEDVKERYYMGNCQTEERYSEIVEIFREKKNDLYNLVEGSPYLKEKTRKYIIRYIDQFYDMVDKPNVLERRLLNNCKK